MARRLLFAAKSHWNGAFWTRSFPILPITHGKSMKNSRENNEIPRFVMRRNGKLSDWNDERGFGFIAPLDGGARVFVHISSFSNRRRRPTAGDAVSFALSADGDGRAQAVEVAFAGDSPIRAFGALSTGDSLRILIAVVFIASVAALASTRLVPVYAFWIYAGASAVAFAAYVFDKSAARNDRWRVQESTLHLWALIGGWPGALIAQVLVRHKTRKLAFQVVFWLTVVLNVAGAALLVKVMQHANR